MVRDIPVNQNGKSGLYVGEMKLTFAPVKGGRSDYSK
jgi:hypothetical protein